MSGSLESSSSRMTVTFVSGSIHVPVASGITAKNLHGRPVHLSGYRRSWKVGRASIAAFWPRALVLEAWRGCKVITVAQVPGRNDPSERIGNDVARCYDGRGEGGS